MKTFKIFLENAAKNLATLRVSSEERKRLTLQRINQQRQQKKEDEELEDVINKEIMQREKAAKNKKIFTKPEDQKRQDK